MRRIGVLVAVTAFLLWTPMADAAVEPTVVQVNADDAWADGHRGQGVVVGVVGTGVHWQHPALKDAYRGWDGAASHAYNWHDAIHGGAVNACGFDAPAPCDDSNHGSAVTGVAVGYDGGANQIGVAPDARWIACRATNESTGTVESFAECLEFMRAPTDLAGENPDPSRRPDVVVVVDCAPADGCGTTSLHAELQALNDAGVLVVAGAGNSGSACATVTTPPATAPSVLAVGAVNGSDVIAAFSSRGPATGGLLRPGVVAPGVNVRSSTTASGYGNLSGTSLAAPSAAGVAALLLSSSPDLRGRPDELARLVQAGAAPLTSAQGCGGDSGTAVPNHAYGHGRVDATAAIARRAAEPTVDVADAAAAENAGSVPVVVSLSAAGVEAASVEVVAGTATTVVSFAPGETVKEAAVPIPDDTLVETGETIPVTLRSPVAARLGRSAATVAISDDDVLPAAGGPPGGPGAFPPPPDIVAPVLRRLRIAPARFRRGRATTIQFRLSEAAQVTFGVQRRVRRRWRRVRGSIVRSATAGANTVRFTGRLRGRRLRAGRYRLAARPVDTAGNAGALRRATFRVRRPTRSR